MNKHLVEVDKEYLKELLLHKYEEQTMNDKLRAIEERLNKLEQSASKERVW